MPITEQLRLRAILILHDGRRHSQNALAWAWRTARLRGLPLDDLPELVQSGDITPFNLREISLGAHRW